MSSKCNCPSPPGGGTDCPSGSLAICRSQNGKCETSCRNIPEGLSRNGAINWQINLIRNENRPLTQNITTADLQFLSSGKYLVRRFGGSNITISFSSPSSGLFK